MDNIKKYKLREHRTFLYVMATNSFLFLGLGICYILYSCLYNMNILQIIFKPIPMLLLIFQTLIYMKIYDYHRYAMGIMIVFILFAIGDIFLALSLLSSSVQHNLDKIYFMIGMGFFLIGRLCLIFTFLILPYRYSKYLWLYRFQKWHLMNIILILFAGIISFFYIYYMIHILPQNTSIKTILPNIILIPLYIMITMFTCITSIVRYRLLSIESSLSTVLPIIGTILFALSDSMIGYITYINNIIYSNIFIMSTYWIGMLLISWSIIRNWNRYNDEKHGMYYDLMM